MKSVLLLLLLPLATSLSAGTRPRVAAAPRAAAVAGEEDQRQTMSAVERDVSEAFPGSKVVMTEAVEGVSMSTVFWSVLEGVVSEAEGGAPCGGSVAFVAAGPEAMPLLDAFVGFVGSIELLQETGLSVEAVLVAETPTIHFDVAAPDSWFSPAASAEEIEVAVERVRSWVSDVIVDSRVCPFTSSPDVSGTGLSAAGVEPGAVLYPTCDAADSGTFALVTFIAAFWRATVDLLSQPPEVASSTLLVVPKYALKDHSLFLRATSAIVANLKLVRADDEAALVFFHPLYNRDDDYLRQDRPIHGHLPPTVWLRAYLRLTRSNEEVDSLTEAQLQKANYQRRAPCLVVNILRAEQVDCAEAVVPSAIIEPAPGRRVRVTGAKVYSANTWRLATKSTTKVDADGHEYLVVEDSTAQ